MASLSTLLPGVSPEEVTAIAVYTGGFSQDQLQGFAASYMTQRKSPSTAFWIAFFFGTVGGHYYYLGDTGKGLLYTFTLGIVVIGALIDLFRTKTLTINANAAIARQITAGVR